MTIAHALHDLQRSVDRLSEAVTELVMIAHEDRPSGPDTAAGDHLAEQVSELQSAVVTAHQELDRAEGPTGLAEQMPLVDDALADAELRYWRDLRSYDATAAMRRAARRGGPAWQAWQASVEQSQQRCEQPLVDVLHGARAVWTELAQLVSLWLAHPPPQAPADPSPFHAPIQAPTTDAAVPAAENTRRST